MSQIPAELARLFVGTGRGVETRTLLDRIPVGQVVQAEVIRVLGDDLFSLSLRGATLSASSKLPLNEGDRLNVSIARDPAGATSLQVVSVDPKSPAADATNTAASASQSLSAARSAASTATRPEVSTEPRPETAPAARQEAQASEPLAGKVRPEGPVAQLARERPDLVGRLETLTKLFRDRPSGLGEGIDRLAAEVREIARPAQVLSHASQETSPQPPALIQTAGRLLKEVLGPSELADASRVAHELASRWTGLARGLEATLARVLGATPTVPATAPVIPDASVPTVPSTSSTPASEGQVAAAVKTVLTSALLSSLSSEAEPEPDADPTLAAPKPTAASLPNASQAEAPARSPIPEAARPVAAPIEPAGKEVAPAKEGSPASAIKPTAAVDASAGSRPEVPASVRGVLEGDLKGQLLELRSQLAAMAADRPEAAAAVQSAMQRTDLLIQQVTAQQLRNVDGLNQFVHVEVPIDPKTGVDSARLQVFYRDRGAGAELFEDDRFTVAIFLELSRLGPVLATVTGVDGSVSVAFTVDRPETKQWLSETIEELRGGLVEAGHQGAMITVREKEPPKGEQAAETGETDLRDEFLAPSLAGIIPGGQLDREA